MDLSTERIRADLFAIAEDRQQTTWLVLRLLGVIAFLAFLSFHLQLPGLIGTNGILPAEERIDMVRGDGTPDILQFPSLLTYISSDAGLTILTLGGMAVSLTLILNIAPTLSLILLWLLQMSLVVAGGPFTEHQTDILLTETLFVCIFLAPNDLLPDASSPSKLAVDAVLVVLAKLLIFSGVMKLFGSPLWRNLGAVETHLLTQPLPSPLAWYGAQLPNIALQAATLAALGIELIAPLLLFSHRRFRIPAAWAIIGLQAGIFAFGSFGLLNLLASVLAVLALDDTHLQPVFERLESLLPAGRTTPPSRIAVGGILAYLILSLGMVSVSVTPERSLPDPVLDVADRIDATETINRLGVYAHLPEQRNELLVEGRWNGTWRRYRFKMKPDTTAEPPPWQQVLVPRLDLWMTDEAHRSDRSIWFTMFLRELQKGNDDVEDLLETVPSHRPPAAVRVLRQTYRFTTWAERRRTGRWWDGRDTEVLTTVNDPPGR